MNSAVNILANNGEVSKYSVDKLDKYINDQMKTSKIPGMSVIIVKGEETIYKKSLGYSDIKNENKVTPNTLFEVGSNSKAFTALGILELEKKGLINLKDPVDKYVPWLKMKYNGQDAQVTIEQIFYHTSGIPYKSINKISVSEDDNALEDTVKTLKGLELFSRPGSRFEYATINYDILGLLIQTITKQSFEEYIKKNILEPAGLYNTFLFREDAVKKDMSKGYKMFFLKPRQYDAPIYRGNTPSGYFIMNSNDMEKWIKIQLGEDKSSKLDSDLIDKSHIPNTIVNKLSDGASYAAGWIVNKSKDKIYHGGINPNFSSGIVLKTNTNTGVAVLANMNSDFTQRIVFEIQNILDGNEPIYNTRDINTKLDKLASNATIVLLPVLFKLCLLLTKCWIQILKGIRKFYFNGVGSIIGYALSLMIILALEYLLYKLPQILAKGVSWKTARLFAPNTLFIAALEIGIMIILFFLYFVSTNFN